MALDPSLQRLLDKIAPKLDIRSSVEAARTQF